MPQGLDQFSSRPV